MWFAVKRLSLGLILIAGAAAVLLATDVRRSGPSGVPRIGILQHASIAVLDDSVRGLIDGLSANGYRDGETARITFFNAQGETTTANDIAVQMTNGRFDLAITSSTLSLQAVANANKAGRTMHVFGIVADPYVAGVGLDPANPLAHPKHLVGQGILFPVQKVFGTARRMFPGLKSVGVAWDPAQVNSRRFVEDARIVCAELGIKLLEAQVQNTAGVREAIDSVIGRGAQAVWVGGDVTVSNAIETVIPTCRQARIPVFSQLTGDPRRGTLFDMGFDYYQAGELLGELAAKILDGADPAAIPIRDVKDLVPHRLLVNQKTLHGLRDPWRIPDDLLREADVVVDEAGVPHERGKKHSKNKRE
jgi:putative ABC transport system substrate-binding protein